MSQFHKVDYQPLNPRYRGKYVSIGDIQPENILAHGRTGEEEKPFSWQGWMNALHSRLTGRQA